MYSNNLIKLSTQEKRIYKNMASIARKVSPAVKMMNESSASMVLRTAPAMNNIYESSASMALKMAPKMNNIYESCASMVLRTAPAMNNIYESSASMALKMTPKMNNIYESCASMVLRTAPAMNNIYESSASMALKLNPIISDMNKTMNRSRVLELRDIIIELNKFSLELRNYNNIYTNKDSVEIVDEDGLGEIELKKKFEELNIKVAENINIIPELNDMLYFIKSKVAREKKKLGMFTILVSVATLAISMCTNFENDFVNLDQLESTNSDFLYNENRLVQADILNIRSNNSKESLIVGKLNKGDNVKTLEDKGNWTLVEYIDANTNQSKFGWVFSKYITRYN